MACHLAKRKVLSRRYFRLMLRGLILFRHILTERAIRTAIAILMSSVSADVYAAGPSLMTRGIYINSNQSIPTPDALRKYGITEIHVFANENCVPWGRYPCRNKTQKFVYENGWTAESVRKTLQLFKREGFNIALIISPQYRNKMFVDSLLGPDGPLTIVNEFPDADLELDLEANFSEIITQKDSNTDLDPKDAAKLLVKTIRDNVRFEQRHFIVSTTSYYRKHHEILAAAADTISPQVYEAHWSYSPNDVKYSIRDFLVAFPAMRIVPALSVECDGTAHLHDKCSESNFEFARVTTASIHACNKVQYPGYMIWGSNELNEHCEGTDYKGVCSYFGKTALEQNAHSDPPTTCNTNIVKLR
jgi:hypothetical protein